ncbi:hypothetical protein A4X09_0g2130 [Tilletia walkeri]|uniref:AAA+ ATPase domain-containing protein n=1 Tax=Tilletia walkeri TaxID=117179 RepID=A0A8X7T645_9BASI|nr:hypothetical protein A4X09_0g2130 [Tilletia walkeri]
MLKTIQSAPGAVASATFGTIPAAGRKLHSTLISLFSRLNLFNAYGLLTNSNASLRILLLALLATHGRILLSTIQSFVQDRLVLQVQLSEREEPWEWFQTLWQAHEIGRDSRNFAVAPLKEGEKELVASGADVPLRTMLRQSGSTSFLFSPKTSEIFSTWKDLLRVPATYRSPLSLPSALHPFEIALLRLLPFTSHSANLAWLTFGSTIISMRPTPEVFVNTLTLTRSRAPLEAIIKKARGEYMQEQVGFTKVMMPDSSRQNWETAFTRPRRSADNVVLEEKKKRALFDDARAFFDPVNQTWMAQRGLPYRRGYMLYGPPGNGKTSSVVALAGEIYMLNLNDKDMDESALLRLTQQCSTPCLLLLEDIDAVYTGRQRASEGASAPTPEGGDVSNGGESTQLSFSSLLQVLDGAGSSENRLLIMTTNHPERLDPALIRPGRIDVKVCFENASRSQARDLFIRIFSDYDDSDDLSTRPESAGKSQAELAAQQAREEAAERARFGGRAAAPLLHSSPSSKSLLDHRTSSISLAQLNLLADEFAREVPDDRSLSMATLQGFLIRQALRVDQFGDLGAAAEGALRRFPAWRDRQRASASRAGAGTGAEVGNGEAATDLDLEGVEEEEGAYEL